MIKVAFQLRHSFVRLTVITLLIYMNVETIRF